MLHPPLLIQRTKHECGWRWTREWKLLIALPEPTQGCTQRHVIHSQPLPHHTSLYDSEERSCTEGYGSETEDKFRETNVTRRWYNMAYNWIMERLEKKHNKDAALAHCSHTHVHGLPLHSPTYGIRTAGYWAPAIDNGGQWPPTPNKNIHLGVCGAFRTTQSTQYYCCCCCWVCLLHVDYWMDIRPNVGNAFSVLPTHLCVFVCAAQAGWAFWKPFHSGGNRFGTRCGQCFSCSFGN